MLERFYPDHEVQDAYGIDYEGLFRKGMRGIIFDIDNTLVEHGKPANEQAKQLFVRLHRIGFQTMLLSNNKESRVQSFAQAVDSPYLYKSGKPQKTGYLLSMEKMGTTIQNTLFVGDQIFTDIYGAKRAGIENFLVKPIHPKEEIQIVLKRYLERIVLFFYHRSQSNELGRML